MEPSNAELKISMKMLNANEATASRTPSTAAPIDPKATIKIKQVLNYLPYTCIVYIKPPEDIDWVYYAALDSEDNRLFYQSEYPTNPLPSFSIHDLKTDEKEFRFVCWPVKNDVVGPPTYYGPIPINGPFYLGTYELDVQFTKAEDIALFQKVKPIIEKHCGKAALPGPLSIKEDTHDVYLPSTNTIHLSSNRRNLVHELIHATRKQVLFANKKFKFNEETEVIEEFFAEGLSNMIKDELNQTANDFLPAGQVYGSTHGYNYDFRIADPSLTTQNLQSSYGGILTLENARYFLASEAFHKIAIEYFIKTGKYFAKEFNRLYYDHIQRTMKDPDHELFFSICERLLPTVETLPTRSWLSNQRLFNSAIEPGEKLFMDIDDYYTGTEWIGITKINLYTTFENGSDWAYGNRRYNMNGQSVKIELVYVPTGKVEYSNSHRIPEYANGFGSIKLYFYYKKDSTSVPYFQKQDEDFNIESIPILINNSGLYAIQLTSSNATRSYYHLMGPAMFEGKDKIIIANPFNSGKNGQMMLIHYNRDGKKTVVDPQSMEDHLCIFDVPFIKNKNCEPGILQILTNTGGTRQNLQRNIGYGNPHGGQQFMIGGQPDSFLPAEPIFPA